MRRIESARSMARSLGRLAFNGEPGNQPDTAAMIDTERHLLTRRPGSARAVRNDVSWANSSWLRQAVASKLRIELVA